MGRVDGIVHFVKGALPGETVRAIVHRKKRKHVEAEAVEILESSANRVSAPCPHFGTCGGCSWQHLDYTSQVAWKSGILADALQRIGGMATIPLQGAVAATNSYGYRNKMEFSFSSSAWLTRDEIESGLEYERGFALGLHVPGRFDKVRNLNRCMLQSEQSNGFLEAVHNLPLLRSVQAYNHRTHEGFLRHLVMRTSTTTGAVLSVLITTSVTSQVEQQFVDSFLELHAMLPENSTVLVAVNNTHSPVAVGEITEQRGPGFLEETTHGVTFRISPFSFFQTNTEQMHQLVGLALQAASTTSNDVVWDLYCGTGTLTLPAAHHARYVVGAELVQSSINDAVSNASRNGINNVEFHALDLHAKNAIQQLEAFPTPDVIIIDPPRSGMHPQVAEHLRSIAPSRLAYVSCNPATMARDTALLHDLYHIEWVRAVDMFPQTSHVEAVAALSKR